MLLIGSKEDSMLTFEEATKLFRYSDGHLYWAIPGPKRNINAMAGHTDRSGYTRIMIAGKMYLAHRIIWLIHNGSWPCQSIDHIDGDTRNNRIENLRDVSHSSNMRTAVAKHDNKTGTRGISYDPRVGSYILRLQGKYLGSFSSLTEANKAREAYVKANPYS